GIRIGAVSGVEVRVDRHVGGRRDRRDVLEHGVARHEAIAVRQAHREGGARAGGGERRETQVLEPTRRADVPRVRHHEAALLVQAAERATLLGGDRHAASLIARRIRCNATPASGPASRRRLWSSSGGTADVLGWWQAVVLGLVEGVTKYLPVSSTGHLILTTSLLGLPRGADGDALDTFLIVIQGGAILAVLALYWPRVVSMVRGLVGRDPHGLRLACHVALAFAPAAVVGLLAGKHVKALLFGDWPVIAALAAGGLWMLWLGRRGSTGMRVDDMA